MTYGKTADGGTTLHLSESEDAQLRAGETVWKEGGWAGGNFTITVKMTFRLGVHQIEALELVRRREGRGWKASLRGWWESGKYPDYYDPDTTRAILQQLRNAHWFGPTGLNKYRAPKVLPPTVEECAQAIRTAFDWHSGGGSPFYRFASNRKLDNEEHRWGALTELDAAAACGTAGGGSRFLSPEDRAALDLLRRVLTTIPVGVEIATVDQVWP